jgi:hypothetical protein
VPTLVKVKGTNNSAILSNNTFFGTPQFPTTTNIETGAAFNPITSFNGASLGTAHARVVLVWARHTEGAYEPVFRIDVITGNNPDRGVHSFSYVYSTLVTTEGTVGFYGKNKLLFASPNNDCYSYVFTGSEGAWVKGAPRSNCPVASDSAMDLSCKINGTAKTLLDDGIALTKPSGEVSGTTCDGAGCHSYVFPTFNTWDGYCPGNTVDRTISTDGTLAGGCYRTVSINASKTLTLTDSDNAYYIKTLNWAGNNAVLNFANIPADKKINIYVQNFVVNSDHVNGNRLVNTNNKPHQLQINYLGTDELFLNGTASIRANITAPYAPVTVDGDFNYNGGIQALTLEFNGRARPMYDEGIGAPPVLKDLKFALKKASQRYR